MAKDHLTRIFERLYQVKESDSSTEQGMGLGLYLCRELVQLHGGEIWVESKPDQGSAFHFSIPRGAPALPEPDLTRSGKEPGPCFVQVAA